MEDTRFQARKLPRQARAKMTVDCLLVAAERILAKQGPSAFTTNHVARLAGVSVGSLYQYFPNKQAIAMALLAERRAAGDARLRSMAESVAASLRPSRAAKTEL